MGGEGAGRALFVVVPWQVRGAPWAMPGWWGPATSAGTAGHAPAARLPQHGMPSLPSLPEHLSLGFTNIVQHTQCDDDAGEVSLSHLEAGLEGPPVKVHSTCQKIG